MMNMQRMQGGSMQMNNMMNGFQAAGATKPMSNGMLQQQAEDDKKKKYDAAFSFVNDALKN